MHTAQIVNNWFCNNEVEVLEWPSRSPDLNIIENAWSLIKNASKIIEHINRNHWLNWRQFLDVEDHYQNIII